MSGPLLERDFYEAPKGKLVSSAGEKRVHRPSMSLYVENSE